MRQLRYLEPLIIIAWALIVMTPYRDLNPAIFPDNGSWGEFMSATQGNVAWVHFRECGLCFLWNGSINGGAPAFADPYSSIAHPFAAATYFAFGAVNGGKLMTILAVALGALAVWWLAYELRTSPIARLWAGCMAVVSGHMIGRLSLGIPGVILATASASLLFPAYLRLKERNDNLSTVLLAVAVWLTATSGQGYVQIGICAVFALWVILQGRIPGKAIGAGLVGLLLSGWFLIPFVSFLPHFAKDVTLDAGWGQPLEHMLLNLVVRDLSYYGTEFMHKLPYPWIYYNYVGWIPLTLAAFGLRRRRGLALGLIAVAAIVIASKETFLWLVSQPATRELAAQVRGYPLIAMIAIPPLLALAALGLDAVRRPLRPLALALAIGAIVMAYGNVDDLVRTRDAGDVLAAADRAAELADSGWTAMPFGVHDYVAPAVERGLKLSPGVQPWR